MRKVFLDNLPKVIGKGKKECINWLNSVGYKNIKFIYDDIEGELDIVDYNKKDKMLSINYKNNIYQISIGHFPKCALGNILFTYTYEEVKNNINKLGYELLDDKYKDKYSKLTIKDSHGYLYFISYYNLYIVENKPILFYMGNPYTIQNIKLWLKLNNKPYELLSDTYINARDNLKWKCLKEDCGEIFEKSWNYIQSNKSCPYCDGQLVGLSNCLATRRPDIAKQWHPVLNDNLTPYDVTYNSSLKVWWQCEKGHEWPVSIHSRISNNSGCPCCSGFRATKDNNLLIIFPEICEEWDYEKNKKKPEDFTPHSGQRVHWICSNKKCNHKWKTSIKNRTSKNTGCPKCNESKGEKRISKYLDKHNILYTPQYIFDDLKGDTIKNKRHLKFDFAIFDNNNNIICLIEYDGEFHFRTARFSKDKKKMLDKLKKIQIYDIKKNLYCAENDIQLIRIPYWEFDNIEKYLNYYLKEEYLLVS